MKILVVVHTRDTFFALGSKRQAELLEDSFAFVERQKKSGVCKEMYYLPGYKGTASIWEVESAEEITLRFLENPMSTYEEAQIYMLSDWKSFVNITRKLYHRRVYHRKQDD